MLHETLMDLVIPTIALHSNHHQRLQREIINHKVSYMSQAENKMKIKVSCPLLEDAGSVWSPS